MSLRQRYSGAPWLYDEDTGDIVGIKDPDGSETLIQRIPDVATFIKLADVSAVANTPVPITYDVTYISRGITLVDGSKIKVRRKAIINLQFSFVFANTDNTSNHDVSLWIKKNGVNLQGTNTDITVLKRHAGVAGKSVAAWNYFLEAVAGDEFEMVFSCPSTLVSLKYTAAQSNPTRPETPSAIVTVNEVDGHYPL